MFKVLIVEDEDIIREGLRYTVDWVSLECVVVGEATNGVEALEKIPELTPDIVLLDVNMPLKSGIDFLEESIDDFIFSTIIISGYDEFNYAKKAIEFGVSEYLLKPIVPKELIEAIERAKKSVQLKKQYQIIESNFTSPEEINVLNLNEWNAINNKSKHVNKMIAYIEENFSERISIHDMVYELGMSTTYLNQKFKERTSYTFNEFLNRYRIQKAIERIKIGEDKISMIAVDVGFSNYRYFIKVFKKYTKTLPSDFAEYFGNE